MNSTQRILITGASGMIARQVASALKQLQRSPIALGRSTNHDDRFDMAFTWNPSANQFDTKALIGTDAIVHLAGASIADHKWTPARKKEILESRTRSTEFLAHTLQKSSHSIKTIVAASATGFYGNSAERLMSETDAAGDGFLAETCQAWEESLHKLALPGIRLVILRIGFVIDRSGGALPVMARPVRWMAGAAYGSGKQFISWIDSSDLIRLFIHSLDNTTMNGTFNAVAPQPVRNTTFIQEIGRTLHRPIWPINIPSFVFKTLLGEQSELVLGGQYVSADKTLASDFHFNYPSLPESLHHHLA